VSWLDDLHNKDPYYHAYPDYPEVCCDGGDMYFDRALCPIPCHAMHERCNICHRAIDGCVHEQDR
jgi:hypothetical protein